MLKRFFLRRDLRAAARLIQSAYKYTSGTTARNSASNPVSAIDPDAVRWNLLGAILTAAPTKSRRTRALQWVSPFDPNLSHWEALDLLDRRIKAC